MKYTKIKMDVLTEGEIVSKYYFYLYASVVSKFSTKKEVLLTYVGKRKMMK